MKIKIGMLRYEGLNSEDRFSAVISDVKAAYTLAQEGQKGCKTVFNMNIAPLFMSAESGEEFRESLS